MSQMLKLKKTSVALAFALLLCSGCDASSATQSSEKEATAIQWLSNNYTGFDYSRGQLNISGDGTAVTSSLPCKTTVCCEIKTLFSGGCFDLLFGYTNSPIYYEMTSLAAPTALSGVIFRITEENVTLLYVEKYKERVVEESSFAFGERREVTFGKTGETMILKIDGQVLFEEKLEMDVGDYYGFGAHDGAILRVYDIKEETP